jgi:hypothetical protein
MIVTKELAAAIETAILEAGVYRSLVPSDAPLADAPRGAGLALWGNDAADVRFRVWCAWRALVGLERAWAAVQGPEPVAGHSGDTPVEAPLVGAAEALAGVGVVGPVVEQFSGFHTVERVVRDVPPDGVTPCLPGTNMVRYRTRGGDVREAPRDVLDRLRE